MNKTTANPNVVRLFDQYQGLGVNPNSVEPLSDPPAKIRLNCPPEADCHKLGSDTKPADRQMLVGANVLDFVKHYSDTNVSRFYFRGEPLYSTELLPSLLRPHNLKPLLNSWQRNDPIQLEKDLLHRFKRYTWHIFHAESDFIGQQFNTIESLCVAQHNGLPTMLQDWSLNPFIALFFAARYPTRFISEERKLNPATVWVMKLKPPGERMNETIHLEERKGASDDQAADRFVEQHGQYCPLIVVPLSFTRRIDAQSGRFIYCRCLARIQQGSPVKSIQPPVMSLREWQSRQPWVKIDQWTIPGDQRDEVLNQIRILGFHDGKMFPDLKGWANYLQAGHK